jgi:hypothetical protein
VNSRLLQAQKIPHQPKKNCNNKEEKTLTCSDASIERQTQMTNWMQHSRNVQLTKEQHLKPSTIWHFHAYSMPTIDHFEANSETSRMERNAPNFQSSWAIPKRRQSRYQFLAFLFASSVVHSFLKSFEINIYYALGGVKLTS